MLVLPGNNATSAVKSLFDARHKTAGTHALSIRSPISSAAPLLTQSAGKHACRPVSASSGLSLTAEWSKFRPVSSGWGRPEKASWGLTTLEPKEKGWAKSVRSKLYEWGTPALGQGRVFRFFSPFQAHTIRS